MRQKVLYHELFLSLRPNSGRYLTTAAFKSNSPLSASIRATMKVIVLVVELTLMIVSSPQGGVLALSSCHAHISTTYSPSAVVAKQAPISPLVSKLFAKALSTPLNRSSHCPCISISKLPPINPSEFVFQILDLFTSFPAKDE